VFGFHSDDVVIAAVVMTALLFFSLQRHYSLMTDALKSIIIIYLNQATWLIHMHTYKIHTIHSIIE